MVVGLLGEEGEKVIKAVKGAAARFASKDRAKTLKSDILKLAVKGKFLADEKMLTEVATS